MAIEDVKGLQFPLTFGPLGHFERASGIEKIKTNMATIILTSLEERLMEPQFGSVGMSMLFRNMSSTSYSLIRQIVADAIFNNEPRVLLKDVIVTGGQKEGRVEATVEFSLKESGEFAELTLLLGD